MSRPSTTPQRIVVTRGDRYDVAEWAPGSAEWFGAGTSGVYRPSSAPHVFAALAALVAIVAMVAFLRVQSPTLGRPLVATVADVSAVHAGVTAGSEEVRRVLRVAGGDAVATDEAGRARLRLDDGTTIVMDHDTKIVVREGSFSLEKGRVFLLGVVGAHTLVDLGGAEAIVSAADVGMERRASATKVYVANGEVTLRPTSGTALGAETIAHTGESATIDDAKIAIAPERDFDDWTGGMAAPWGAHGAPKRAVGELWGRPPAGSSQAGEAGSPLTIRAHDVRATVTGELAETETQTTFFNAGSTVVSGDFRMAVPPGAIVSRFAVKRDENLAEAQIALAARKQSAPIAGAEVLEWAGEGWVRGTVPSIAPGKTVTVIVGYSEWLSPRPRGDGKSLVVQYRYPMAGDAKPPLVGEFSARVDAGPSSPISMAAGLGARVVGQAVEVRRPDFRPTADLVVDVEIPGWTKKPEGRSTPVARLYAADAAGDDDAGGTVLVRTEVPAGATAKGAQEGVALALVIDASASIEPALFDAERALVDAVLGGLGPRDRVVVLAADQTVRALGPATLGAVDAARRKAVADALATLSPGGATDLGRALEAGADALPADAPAGMVVYVGDGWPTVGDATVGLIAARLSRRKLGAPRMGAVAVGPLANRLALAGLVRGTGPLFEIADSTDAARVAVSLLSEALRPTVAGVELELGPDVERVYPRTSRAIAAGDTISTVGRVRGDAPRTVTLRWRDGAGRHEEIRDLVIEKAASENDVRRRWAEARVDEIALRGTGREAATDVALRASLLTPWTGWAINAGPAYVPSRLETRVLDLASGAEGFTAAFATPESAAGTLAAAVDLDADAPEEKDEALKAAVSEAAGRIVDGAGSAVRACRDSRAALRPDLGGTLDVSLELDGDGKTSAVKVRGGAGADDAALDRCIELVVEGLVFPESGLKVKIEVRRRIELPPPRSTPRGRRCSPTSTLPMPLRRGIWRERLDHGAAATVYLDAKASCELATWTDRRALLELVLLQVHGGLDRVAIARTLEQAGEVDAATLLRREAVRRANGPDELRSIARVLIGDEHYPAGIFRKRYAAQPDDASRLALVRKFLAIAPHDARLRRRSLALLEALGMKPQLAEEVRRARLDPFADAGLLADGAAALARIGDVAEARRTFGELAERAPSDPWARAFLGDRLRNQGWFDDAVQAYGVLGELTPDDPAATLRLALAEAGAGRLDIAVRSLTRVAETGGRGGDAKFGELASWMSLALLAEGRARSGVTADDAARMDRVALELPRPAGATLVLVRTPAASAAIEAGLVRGPKGAREERQPEVAAASIGVYALRLDAGDVSDVTLRLKRPRELPPGQPFRAHVDALVPVEAGKPPRLVSTDVDVPGAGTPVELKWSGSAWSR